MRKDLLDPIFFEKLKLMESYHERNKIPIKAFSQDYDGGMKRTFFNKSDLEKFGKLEAVIFTQEQKILMKS